jgi:hypothetical protein
MEWLKNGATWGVSMKTDFFSSKAGFRGSRKSAAKWCRMKRIEQRIISALELGNEGDRVDHNCLGDRSAKRRSARSADNDRNRSGKLRTQLQAAGVPNLWIPKTIGIVEQIPVLATGKLDLRKCSELAAAAVASEKSPA